MLITDRLDTWMGGLGAGLKGRLVISVCIRKKRGVLVIFVVLKCTFMLLLPFQLISEELPCCLVAMARYLVLRMQGEQLAGDKGCAHDLSVMGVSWA